MGAATTSRGPSATAYDDAQAQAIPAVTTSDGRVSVLRNGDAIELVLERDSRTPLILASLVEPLPASNSSFQSVHLVVGVPVVVHSRGAFRECVEMIDASGVDWRRVVFHCFSEGPAEMEALTGVGAGFFHGRDHLQECRRRAGRGQSHRGWSG